MKAAVVGGSGYVGGELVRILLGHPALELTQVTSRRFAGQPFWAAHPNLRHLRDSRFTDVADLDRAEVIFSALPAQAAVSAAGRLIERCELLVDLSPGFRGPGAADESGLAFVPGLPELYRDRLAGARRISIPGCMATAAILALHPLTEAGLTGAEPIVDARTGSSGSGSAPSPGSVHAERAGAMRVYRAVGHRHQAEVATALGTPVRMTVTAVPRVRGIQVVAHVFPPRPVSRADVWAEYRSRYTGEPFVRLAADRTGTHRLPDPSVLSGSNFCDVGFDVDADGRRVVAVSALDNLVKGAAGGAVQSANVALGLPEDAGLGFCGIFPS